MASLSAPARRLDPLSGTSLSYYTGDFDVLSTSYLASTGNKAAREVTLTPHYSLGE
jgi:hypothetical protein